MNKSLEKFCVEALESYYNSGGIDFLDNVDDDVVWYGPSDGQIIVGKENLKRYLHRSNSQIRFSFEDVSVKLFPLKADAFVFFSEYSLYAYFPDGRVRKYRRHLIVVSKKKKDENGNYAWKSPLIHISDVTRKQGNRRNAVSYLEEENSLVDILMKQRKSVKKLLLSGRGNSNYYVAEDAIVYIEGGKGVQCYVHTMDDTLLVTKLMKDIEKLLPDYYYRCHASYIVNLRHIKKIGNYKITLDTGEEIPIPAKKYATVKAYINAWRNENKTEISI